jgi:hypothetical protein
MTPKGMRAQKIPLTSGESVHIYSNDERFYLQLRRDVPTEADISKPSFKVAVELSHGEAVAIAGELLTVAAAKMKKGKN